MVIFRAISNFVYQEDRMKTAPGITRSGVISGLFCDSLQSGGGGYHGFTNGIGEECLHPASKSPSSTRQATMAVQWRAKPIPRTERPHAVIRKASHTLAPMRRMIKLDGTSKIPYVMKNTSKAIEYRLPRIPMGHVKCRQSVCLVRRTAGEKVG